MTPIYLNSSPSPFPTHDLINHQDDQTHLFLSPNFQPYSSSNSLSSAQDHQAGFHQQEADNFGARSYDQIENENEIKGLKFSIWKKEVVTNNHQNLGHDDHQVKWMSSKMRVMLKMKKPDPVLDINVSPNASPEAVKVEDQKLPLSPDHNYSSNSSSSNSPPIRVCSDCNTTKTPLWRSGPCGPKTLCNACGIRQRKARRAMAAAAENGTVIPVQTSLIKDKLQVKDKKSPSSGHITKYKKKCKPSPPSSPGRKNCFENFLMSLSKNSAFHRVFPQDEKEAAILLMALSCGYLHG